MNWFKKSLPSGETSDILIVKTWEVRWTSRSGQFHSDTRKELAVFTDETMANHFKQALEDAFKLIKHSSGTKVTIETNHE
jgi:hypothetical protein